MFSLRDYQQSGVDAIREAFRRGRRAPLYVLPTGGGKTYTFSHIASSARALGNRIAILVHRQELLEQASQSLTSLGVPHGLLSPRYTETREAVQVASVQTLLRRLERFEAPDLIITDEAHHAVSSTYRKIYAAFPRARILGVTATPVRGDGKGLGEIFDELVLGPTISELIKRGALVSPVVYAPPVGLDLAGVRKILGDYDKKELSERVDKPKITGCAVSHYIKYAAGKPAIAFCVSVRHAAHVAEEFRAAGVRSTHVDGGMRDEERRAALEGLRSGAIDVLTSADLIGEGVDVPRVEVAILLRPTHSEALFLQQVGRALRPCEGKTHALVLDHVGNCMRHGLPDDDRGWSLAGSAGARRGAGDGPITRIEQCEKCFFVYETGPEQCPACGNFQIPKIRKLEIEQGELERLTREKLDAAKKKRREVGKAQTLEELIGLAHARGYKNPKYWAEQVMRGRVRK